MEMTDLSGKNLPPGIIHPAKPAAPWETALPLELQRLIANTQIYTGFSSNFPKVLFNWHEDCDWEVGS